MVFIFFMEHFNNMQLKIVFPKAAISANTSVGVTDDIEGWSKDYNFNEFRILLCTYRRCVGGDVCS